MNLNELNKLKEVVEIAIDAEKEREKEDYRRQHHVAFSVGDWVTDDNYIGVVGWVENKCIGIERDDGYFGLDIKNKDGGFKGPCRRNDYKFLSEDLVNYYTDKTTITIDVTGEEIEAFYMTYLGVKNINPHPLKTKLIEAFDSVRYRLDDNEES